MGHSTEEQILYRCVSAARNLAHLGQHEQAAEVAEIGVVAYKHGTDLETVIDEVGEVDVATDGGGEAL